LKHYPYHGFVIISCQCIKYSIISIHKIIKCCILSTHNSINIYFKNMNCRMQTCSFVWIFWKFVKWCAWVINVNCFENKCETWCVSEHIPNMFLHKIICIKKIWNNIIVGWLLITYWINKLNLLCTFGHGMKFIESLYEKHIKFLHNLI